MNALLYVFTVLLFVMFFIAYPVISYYRQNPKSSRMRKPVSTRSSNRSLGRSSVMKSSDSRFEGIVQKLVSPNDSTFGQGLTEVLAIPESDPARLRAIREAIRRRSGKTNVQFYESDVGQLTKRPGEEVKNARDRVLQLARKRELLADPRMAGSFVAAFSVFFGFDAVRSLAVEVRNVGGLDQFQAFQLLYNQNRSAVVLQTSLGKKTWTQKHGEV